MAAADTRVEAIMSDDIAVKLEGVTKRFGTVAALREAHLSVRRGELMALLGPSGCGKTTLLNLVAGFFPPDEGDVTIDQRRVNNVPTYKREIGIMFQNYALFPHMTVAANVGYGLRMRGVGKAEIKRRVADALALVRLSGVEDRKPRQLSGGQQQRVAIARALVINPKVLLLDEPFSALDRNLRTSMQIELKEIQRKLGVTTIFVTHDQGEALSLADRIAVMSEGRICQIGTPQEIYRRPSERFVVGFVGDVNVLRGRLDSRDGDQASVQIGAATRVKVAATALGTLACGGPVDLFVRPEQLHVGADDDLCSIEGVVAALVYQGGHVDLYLDSVAGADGRVLMRVPGHQAVMRWPVGTRIRVMIDESEVIGFPVEESPQ